MENRYLQHHGVLGQKWGIRRDRMKAGSTFARAGSKGLMSKNKHYGRKKLSDYSNDELRKAIEREKLEREYNDVFNSYHASKGRQKTADALDNIGSLLTVGTAAINFAEAWKKAAKVAEKAEKV